MSFQVDYLSTLTSVTKPQPTQGSSLPKSDVQSEPESAHSALGAKIPYYAQSSEQMQTMNMQDDVMHMADNRISSQQDITLRQSSFPDTSIQTFLSRPIMIHTHLWDPATNGGNFSETIKPWDLVLSNPAMAEKLSRFKLLRADLKVKVLINGSPFHYGRVMVSYSPLSVAQPIVIGGGPRQRIARSQLPRIFIDPTYSKGGCLCIPFYWPSPWFDLANDDFTTYGTLNIDSLNPLRTLGEVKTVTISMVAWLENVEVSGSTFVAQSTGGGTPVDLADIKGSDEYADKNGVISGPATTVAAVSSSLENAPVIGTFAKATTIAANAVGSIARLFGFSRPPNVEPLTLMRNTPYSNLASGIGMDSVQKLTLDPKNELTISPQSVGLDEGDNLSYDFLLRDRDSFVGTFSWSESQAYGTLVHKFAVNPCLIGPGSSWSVNTTGRGLQPTTLHGVSRLFDSWSGTIKFRIQIVAAHAHRGRLMVLFDPSGSSAISSSNIDVYSVTNYNHVIDLAECRDYEFEVHWSQANAYAQVPNDEMNGPTPDWGTGITYDPEINNGTISFVVINQLSSLVSDSTVDINVFISAGKQFELANQRPRNMDTHPVLPPYTAQSLDLTYRAQAAENVEADNSNPEDVQNIPLMPDGPMTAFQHKPMIYFGERFESLRPLMKRYVLYQVYKPMNDTGSYTQWRDWYVGFSRYQFPAFAGWSQTGYDTPTGGTEQFNYVRDHYFMYISCFFAGRKGSVRYKAYINGPGATGEILVNRRIEQTQLGVIHGFNDQGTLADNATRRWTDGHGNTGTGALVTSQGTMQSIEYEVPFMSRYRFYPTRELTPYTFDATINLPLDSVRNQWEMRFVTEDVDGRNSMVTMYTAAGEDYSLSFFVGAPVVYEYPARWPAA